MASPVITSMMAKLDELKDQMSDNAYLVLCNELMKHHRENPPPPPPVNNEDVMRFAQYLVDSAPTVFSMTDPGFIQEVSRHCENDVDWVNNSRGFLRDYVNNRA